MQSIIRALTHDHIDGSAAVSKYLDYLYAMAAMPPEQYKTPEQLIAGFANVHGDLVSCFQASTSLFQTKESLRFLGYSYGKLRAEEGYDYVEGKIAPQYHVFGGLTMREAVTALREGLSRAEAAYGITIFLQLCIGREASPELGMEVAHIALDYDGEVGLDLACDEAGHPPEKHLPAYALTFGSKVKRDCHAGEWVAMEPANTYRQRLLAHVRTAVRVLRCDGISHAIPLVDDNELIREVVDKGIRVSMCPLSNLTLGKIRSVRDLGIDFLLGRGVRVTINPDDDLFLPNMRHVTDACIAEYLFDQTQLWQLQSNPYRSAFDKRVHFATAL